MASENAPHVYRRAAVLGSGVMGRAIAAHFANAGLDVLLLDLPGQDTGPDDPPAKRSQLAVQAIAALAKDRPAPLVHRKRAGRITPGNFEDHLERLAKVDWVLEAVVERFDIKESLFAKLAPHLGAHTLLSSNTSGIPIARLAGTLPAELRPRFLGTHFFNPPRYMHLLEIIPGADTAPEVVASLTRFGEDVLGKGVVLAKDRPNFVANRIGAYGMLKTVQLMLEHGLNPTEVDFLTGPLMGRARSATFRTCDLVGLDTLLHVAGNVRDGAPDDPELSAFEPIPVLEKMVEKKLLGTKSGAGFFRQVKDENGKRIEALDLETFEFVEKPRARFPEIDAIKPIDDLKDRLRALFKAKGKGADFAWAVTREALRYSALVAEEIAEDVAAIDRALRWGFGWELGPFQVWDALGVQKVVERMEADGRPAPEWVKKHLERGATSFYGESESGRTTLDFEGASEKPLPPRPGVLQLREIAQGPRRIEGNQGATLWDLGDGVMGLEFHSKMNSLGPDIVQMAIHASQRAEAEFEGLVVANEGAHFSAGANLALLLMAAIEGEFDEIDIMIRQFQRMTMGLRQCARPVVAAPFGMTLGGGCELSLHADGLVASMELYTGLVEGGVGLIPAGGGTKEMYLRAVDALGDPRKAARQVFETIGLAKVSTSAEEARDLGFLRDRDRIVLNPDHLIANAKDEVLALARGGYTPPAEREDIPVGGADTLALVEVGLHNFHAARQISDHDRKIGRWLGRILSGGAHRSGPSPRTVSERQLLDLEREAFLSLCGERKSLERIQHMLKKGKPLRN